MRISKSLTHIFPSVFIEKTDFVSIIFQLVNAYVEASTTRQLVLTRLASLLEMSLLHNISENFMDLVQAQREEDVEVLKCFADPLNSFREKLIVNEIFSNPHQYYLIWEYLLNLDEMYSDVIDNNHAVICAEEYLQGLCIQLKIEVSINT